MTRLTALVTSGIALCVTQQPGSAQILGEWRLVHSDSAFDYLVTDRGFALESTDLDGARIHRAVASRMLVRYLNAERTDLLRTRRAAGLTTAGYDGYASSTYVMAVRCVRRELWVTETVDYADDGTVLERRRAQPDGKTGPEGWSETAAGAVLDWACRKAGGGGR